MGVCNPLGGDWISFTIGKKSVGQQARVGEEHRPEDWVCSQMQVCIEWALESGRGGNSSEEIYHTTCGRELPLTPEEWPLFKSYFSWHPNRKDGYMGPEDKAQEIVLNDV